MRNLNLYKWSIALMMLVIGTSASAQLFPRDSRTSGIFGKRNDRPVIRQDGSRQWPDGTIQYPDGTTRYPDGTIRYPNGTVSYPRNQRNDRWDNDDHRHNLPPGQAKKIYGGNARDYAHGKKNCNHGNKGNRDWDDRDDRNVNRYPQQYPQTYPQYPQQYPNSKTKRGSRSTNPVL